MRGMVRLSLSYVVGDHNGFGDVRADMVAVHDAVEMSVAQGFGYLFIDTGEHNVDTFGV